jgi:HSP20 family molecular chaperone IbpA
MNTRQLPHPSALETSVTIVPVAPEEQNRRIDAAIAQHAYEIFEKRGGMGWHELEDWRQAEAEIRSHLCVGLTTGDHTVVIGTDAAQFDPGTLEIWAAPRQITICGKSRSHGASPVKTHANAEGHMAFRQIQLPCAVDCTRARTKVHGRFLEIQLPKAMAAPQAERATAA